MTNNYKTVSQSVTKGSSGDARASKKVKGAPNKLPLQVLCDCQKVSLQNTNMTNQAGSREEIAFIQ